MTYIDKTIDLADGRVKIQTMPDEGIYSLADLTDWDNDIVEIIMFQGSKYTLGKGVIDGVNMEDYNNEFCSFFNDHCAPYYGYCCQYEGEGECEAGCEPCDCKNPNDYVLVYFALYDQGGRINSRQQTADEASGIDHWGYWDGVVEVKIKAENRYDFQSRERAEETAKFLAKNIGILHTGLWQAVISCRCVCCGEYATVDWVAGCSLDNVEESGREIAGYYVEDPTGEPYLCDDCNVYHNENHNA